MKLEEAMTDYNILVNAVKNSLNFMAMGDSETQAEAMGAVEWLVESGTLPQSYRRHVKKATENEVVKETNVVRKMPLPHVAAPKK